nr:MAG TPA: hypothetical protein [Herelleviridae sp.]
MQFKTPAQPLVLTYNPFNPGLLYIFFFIRAKNAYNALYKWFIRGFKKVDRPCF